jgi:membrane-bound acyltransferase YfiQ involved in biofilm formation
MNFYEKKEVGSFKRQRRISIFRQTLISALATHFFFMIKSKPLVLICKQYFHVVRNLHHTQVVSGGGEREAQETHSAGLTGN